MDTLSRSLTMHMRKPLIAAILALAAPLSAMAGYNVDATMARDWPGVAGRIAILPSICPADFDCASMNETVAEYFYENSGVVGSEAVSQAMIDIGIEYVDEQNRQALAAELGVMSFLQVVVGNASESTTGAMAYPMGGTGMVGINAIQRKEGSVEVRVVSAEGKLLAKAVGFGESTFRRSSSSVVGRVFDEIYYRLFPE